MTIVFENINVNYKVTGNGPCIVLLHGFTESLKIWEKYTKRLASNFKVIAIDHLGHGETGVLTEEHTMEKNAELVNSILEKENINKAVIIGHSMGGYIALAFADLFPAKTKGIGLFHSTAYPDTEEKKKERMRTIEVVKANKKDFVSDLIPKLFAPENVEKFKIEIESLKEIGKAMTVDGITKALKGMSLRKDRTAVLSEATYPILFIIGKQDNVIPFEKLQPLVGLPKYSECTILDGVGHMGFVEAEHACYQSVEHFSKVCFNI